MYSTQLRCAARRAAAASLPGALPLPPSPHLPSLANLGAELLRENKRMLDRAIRELDRERMGLQNQVRQLVQRCAQVGVETAAG